MGIVTNTICKKTRGDWISLEYGISKTCNHVNDYYSSHTVSYIGCTDWEYNFSVILPFGLGGSLCILWTAYKTVDKWQTLNVVNVTWVTICSSQHPKILPEISSLKRRAITLISFTVFPMYVAHSFHHFRLIFTKINMSQDMNFIFVRYIHPFPLDHFV